MCIVEPKAEPYSNFIRKFEPESNLILVEPELEPEPCDIEQGTHQHLALRLTTRSEARNHLALRLTTRSETRNQRRHALRLTTRSEA
jgi:hypothetical protein